MISLVPALVLALRPLPLHVDGNVLLEDKTPVTLQGVDIPGFDTDDEGRYVFRSARVAIEDWHANCIRLPLSEDRWFGAAGGKNDKGLGYVNGVEEVMNLAENRNAYLILSLSSSDAGAPLGSLGGGYVGPHDMPDDHALRFWKDLALKYRADPHVLFDLYAAPHGVSWDVWRGGGQVDEGHLHYHTPGMQAILDTIRKAGAKNVCVVAGLDGGRDLSGIPDHPLTDPAGRGIVYSATLDGAREDWEAKIASACALAPVIGDCAPSGPVDAYAARLFPFLAAHSLHWLAAGFAPDSNPSLISDEIYTPTPWGLAVKKKLDRE